MKTISFDKLNFESSDILSRLQMKRVKGGHETFCECTCEDGTQFHFTATGQPNTPVQPSSGAIDKELIAECGSVSNGSCTGCTNR